MKELNLKTEKINKLLLSFSIPCVISMLINSVYNIVDQIFIGKGVGSLGNAATNVIFPLIIIFNAVAGLIGNGASANLSLRLGEGKKEEASKSIAQSILLTSIISITLSLIAYLILPKLIYLFGCTESVYPYAIEYGRIIIIGAPFMIMYSALANIIRADGAPKYSMFMLVIGAIINIILDPLCIFVWNMGVKGGAIATVIGQIVSFMIAIMYMKKMKSVKLTKKDFKLDRDILKILSLGLSSFITQGTILVLFVFMNNIMTKYGALSKYGSDIPLSVYGVISKINSLYISTVLGVSIGAQPIIGFNYGAGQELRVKETLKKVLMINFIIGIFFNILVIVFPTQIANIFISRTDPSYELFIEFAITMCRTFLLFCSLSALDITTSIVIQSLGKVKKATMVSFIRQILLLIPISLLLCIVLDKGINGVLIAGAISDVLSFTITIFIFRSEYSKLGKKKEIKEEKPIPNTTTINPHGNFDKVITISREYGSGGRYVAQLLARQRNIPCYDAEIIRLTAKESGFTKDFVEQIEETKDNFYANDDRMFIAETKVIKKLAENPCVIVGRCADYILKDQKNVVKIFLYSDQQSKIKRAIQYYHIDKQHAQKQIDQKNKQRSKHYKYYTNHDWKNVENYDIMLNVDTYGVEATAKNISNMLDSL